MRFFSAANLSLAFVLLGTPLFYIGILSQLGDPYPRPSPEVLARARFYSLVYVNLGAVLLIFSLWLSGRAFSSAPRRSLVAFALSAASVFAFWLI